MRPSTRWDNGAAYGTAIMLVVIMAAGSQPSLEKASSDDRVITIEASSFEYSPPVIRARPGERITIELVATDVVHGLYVDGYDFSLTAEPGTTARGTFVADRVGTFRIRCSTPCGPLHPFMIGKLQVGPNRLFWTAAWVALAIAVTGVVVFRR